MRPAIREKKKKYPRLRNSVVQQKTPPLGLYRGLNQSEIVKGGPPPLIGRGRASRDRHSKYILYVHVFKCLQYTHIYYGNKNLDFWQIMAINGN